MPRRSRSAATASCGWGVTTGRSRGAVRRRDCSTSRAPPSSPGCTTRTGMSAEFGAALGKVDLTGVRTPAEAIARVQRVADTAPAGSWILGQGWDEGAWIDRLPANDLLSQAFPAHFVYLRSLHGFGGWANDSVLARAGITDSTPDPVGGTIGRTCARRAHRCRAQSGRRAARRGRAAAHARRREAQLCARPSTRSRGPATPWCTTPASTACISRPTSRSPRRDALPIRVYAMLSARDTRARALVDRQRAPTPARHATSPSAASRRTTTARSAREGPACSPTTPTPPGYRGVSGGGYGFDTAVVRGTHARRIPGGRARHRRRRQPRDDRLHRDRDAWRVFHPLACGIAWSTRRCSRPWMRSVSRSSGSWRPCSPRTPSRTRRGWRSDSVPRACSARTRGAPCGAPARTSRSGATFRGPDSARGTASTRPSPDRTRRRAADSSALVPGERLTIEEAIRAYTTWASYATFNENSGGVIVAGRWADLTVLDNDPFTTPADRRVARRGRSRARSWAGESSECGTLRRA